MRDLQSLVRGECANLHKGYCVFTDKPCPILEETPAACAMSYSACMGGRAKEGDSTYFEVAVMPFVKVDPKYKKAPAQYAEVTGTKPTVKLTACECGKARAFRKTFCADCLKKKRKESKKKYKLKE